ncbi:MAG: ABC transporter permease [Synechococcaceae bacterium WBA_2_066]|nr:ABC transporter permease [Synechococcaceae bacterium WB6_1A_059]NBP99153.1 ABC transporter permease [Synechococcaceae bacterium WB6_3A_227]NBQ19292.1 ABC transporter permease [Synechococcaceae bacterium WB5_2A_257]NBR44810.1 ABC transporter permease [Synechococcaceae bacterium WB5_2B_268]NBY60590.1 ABC transporter permease [Synechococcaceae bacterium LLD_019]NCU76511.1 ABC transporter permease [Synechococcaceae bacterium WB7_1C_051]NCU91139.1 ABC transporter permease [Synechococcaceae bact
MFSLWLGAYNQGLAYAGLALGVYLTLRVLNFADITVDGSFALGGGMAAVLITNNINPAVALIAAVLSGALAGCVTALIHTRLGVNDLFAGILTSTGLYSITLRLMDRSNIPLIGLDFGLDSDADWAFALSLVALGLIALLALLLATDLGLALRALGNNPTMARANGVSGAKGLTIGIALANGLVALAGGLVAFYQGFADVTMGLGSLILGLGAVIVGESICRPRTIPMALAAVVLGSILFRSMIAIALQLGLEPVDLKLVTALLLLGALTLGRLRLPGLADGGRRV